ncbi:MAG: hypothetical protein NZ473_05660 [Candidatus Kapabacteria bacterium]|nr:hypothetical protein [Candidatus Kapabacteria bacterium]MDW8225073.1 hypothetical protein [Bacteroidota bacterium]
MQRPGACFVLACFTASSLWCGQRPAAPQQNTVTLRYALQPGTEWTYELENRIEMTQSFMGIGNPEGTTVTATVRMPIRYTVLRSLRDSLVLREVVDSLSLSMKAEGVGFIYDTVFSSPQGIATTYIFSPSGRLLSVERRVADSSFWSSVASAPLGRDMFRGGQRRLLTWFLPLPDRAISVGHTWTEERHDTTRDEQQTSIYRASLSHTLEAVVDTLGYRCARIRSELRSLNSHLTARTQFGQISTEMTGSGVTITYAPLSQGVPIFQRGRLQMEGSFALGGQVEALGTIEQIMDVTLRQR